MCAVNRGSFFFTASGVDTTSDIKPTPTDPQWYAYTIFQFYTLLQLPPHTHHSPPTIPTTCYCVQNTYPMPSGYHYHHTLHFFYVSSPTTTSCNQGSRGGGGGGSAGAVAGAVLGVLVAALAVVAAAVVICVLLRRRKKRKQSEQRRTLAVDSVLMNPSYDGELCQAVHTAGVLVPLPAMLAMCCRSSACAGFINN